MTSEFAAMTYDDYAALEGVRSSDLCAMRQSPHHYKHRSDKAGDTCSRAFLRAVHAKVLEPETYEQNFAVCNVRRDARTSAYKDWLAAHPGVTALTEADGEAVEAIASAISHHSVASALLRAPGKSEHTIQWTDEATGLRCKGRIDRLAMTDAGPVIIDLKGYGTTEPREIARMVARGGAHIQAAHYRAGLLAAEGIAADNYLIVYETGPHPDVAVVQLSEAGWIYVGERERRRLLDQLRDCQRADYWPGRCTTVVDLEVPGYMFDDEEIQTEDL